MVKKSYHKAKDIFPNTLWESIHAVINANIVNDYFLKRVWNFIGIEECLVDMDMMIDWSMNDFGLLIRRHMLVYVLGGNDLVICLILSTNIITS